MPTFDSSNFSQTPQGRIALCRPGLLGYGLILREGDQCNFLNPKAFPIFETANAFTPTYFRDMKVLPKLPEGVRRYERPEHWSKYRTAEEFEAAADLKKRKSLRAKRLKDGMEGRGQASLQTLLTLMEVDDVSLSSILQEREHIRTEAHPPAKLNSAMLSSLPRNPTNTNQLFTTRDNNETLGYDWKDVKAMLKLLPDNESEQVQSIEPLFGFQFPRQDGGDTEEDGSVSPAEAEPSSFVGAFGKGKGKLSSRAEST
jgi:hypothetical protein